MAPRKSPRAALAVALLALPAAALAAGAPQSASPKDDADAELAAKVDDAATGRRPEASIPFADRGGIRDWRVVDRDTVLIEGTGGRWYRAELFSPCFDLPYAHAIGFRSSPTGAFDRTGSLVVRGERCPLRSLTETAPPPKRARRGDDATAPPATRTTTPADTGGTAP